MNRLTIATVCFSLVAITLAGCGDEPQTTAGPKKPAASAVGPLPASAITAEKPGEPTLIKDLKASAKEGDSVVVRVVIGGRAEPYVAERAIMTVVDASIEKSCDYDECSTPWDYCCTAPEELKPHLATVQIVDAEGYPLKADLSGAAFKPFDTIVVAGTVAARPDKQTLIINTKSVYVEKAETK